MHLRGPNKAAPGTAFITLQIVFAGLQLARRHLLFEERYSHWHLRSPSCIVGGSKSVCMVVQALEEVKVLAHQTTDTAGRLDELIEAVETATAERDLARKQLLVSFLPYVALK